MIEDELLSKIVGNSCSIELLVLGVSSGRPFNFWQGHQMTKLTDTAPENYDKPETFASDARPKVYVVDDEREVRRSLHLLLSTNGMVSWPFASASDFLDNLDGLEPAPILLDIRMPDIDGLGLMTALQKRAIDWPIIIISAHGDVRVAVKAIKLGAIEFLEKPFEFEVLQASLEVAFAKLARMSNTGAVRKSAREKFELLSTREFEVTRLLMRGVPNKSAAHELSLSVRTVEMHRANALAKLQVKSIAEVIRLANDAGIGRFEKGINGNDYGG